MPNEPQWLLEQHLKYGNVHKRSQEEGLPVEAIEYDETLITEYEEKNGVPYLVDKLQLKSDYMFDSDILAKVRAVEEYILQSMAEEKLHDSRVGYETILERMLNLLPDPLERLLSQKENQKALRHLFLQVAMGNKLSAESYLKKIKSNMKRQKVEKIIHTLRTGLKKAVAV